MWKKQGDDNLKATIPNTDDRLKKQPENVEYFNYLGSMLNYARSKRGIKSKIVMAKVAFGKKNAGSLHQQTGIKFKEQIIKVRQLCVVLKLGQFESRSEIPGKFTNWCQRRMEKKSWTDRVNKGEVLQGVEERDIIIIINIKD